MFPILNLGPISVQTGGLILLASIWIGMMVMDKLAFRDGIRPDSLDTLVLYSLTSFIIGGRLFYVLTHLTIILDTPLDIFSMNTTLFDMTGAILTAIVTAIAYVYRKNIPLGTTLDGITPFIATMAIGIGLSHLATGISYGEETNLPWGLEMHGALRHPSQFYEIISSSLIFTFAGIRKPSKMPGERFLSLTAWTSASVLILEAFRGDSTIIAGGFREIQILSWIILAISLTALNRVKSASKENQ